MLKVVVVEDEELVRKGIVLTVDWAGAGCAVVGEAANGEEGLEVIRRYRPDLIVTDIRMPKLDGIEMLRRLREEGNRAHVVFLTAYSDFSYAQSALKLGAADYLLKPFHDGELEETIARIRNPIYNEEKDFLQKEFGLSMIINPELAAAQEISKLLRFPSAIKIDTFARGKVELLKFKVMPEFELDGKSIQQITEHFRCDILFCAIEGKDYTTIPGGTNVIRNGDVISILATPQNAAVFFKKIGLKTHQVKNTVIVGGGTISYYLAKALLAMKIKVKVIEKDKNRCEFLSEELTDATIINGDGTDRSLLLEEGLESAESFVTLTNMDEENIFLSLFAKTISNAKLVAKVNRLAYDDIIDSLDIGSVIYPKYITADYILQYVRATQNSIGSNVETLYHILDGKAEALEFKICDNSPIVGRTLSELNLKKNLLVGCLYRDGSVRIPRGHDALEIGDRVVIVTTNRGLRDINDILAK